MFRSFPAFSLSLLGVALLSVVVATNAAHSEEARETGKTSRAASAPSVAIGTWPTPEMPRVRLEHFFLDKLVANGVMAEEAALNARFELSVVAIRQVDHVGLVPDGDVSSPCFQPDPPEWCIYAGRVIIDGRIAVIDALVENGLIEAGSWRAWRDVATARPLTALAPTLLMQSGVKPKQVLRVLRQAFDATVGMPVPGSELEMYCRKNPQDPICLVARERFGTEFGRQLAHDLALVSLLHREGLLTDGQFTGILTSVGELATITAATRDISSVAGIIIVDRLKVEPNVKAQMSRAIRADQGYVGDAEIGFVKAFCETPYPKKRWPWPVPAPCGMGPQIMKFQRALTLTAQLIKHDVWPEKLAVDAWQELAPVLVRTREPGFLQ